MHINCPKCQTAFDVPDAIFGGRARKLRCAYCSNEWRVEPPAPPPAAPLAPPPAAPPAAVQDAPAPFLSQPPRASAAPTAEAPAPGREPPSVFRQFGKPVEPTSAPASELDPLPAAPKPAPAAEYAAPRPSVTDALRGTVLGADPYDDILETDAFASLVQAARNRALEYEPEPPPPSPLPISNPVFFGLLLVLLAVAVAMLGHKLL